MNFREKLMTGFFLLGSTLGAATAAEKPNILWITSEDNGPHLGCYGDELAQTPNIDSLASRGMIYLNAWSSAPVCEPSTKARRSHSKFNKVVTAEPQPKT